MQFVCPLVTSDQPVIVTRLPFHYGRFATVVDNVLTRDECQELIDMSERENAFELARMHNEQGPYVDTSYRHLLRYRRFDRPLADQLFRKIGLYLPITFAGNPLNCLNERLTFLKYSPHEFFKPHFDTNYYRPDASQLSHLTVLFYLTDHSEQDGGATTILKDPDNGVMEGVSVYPKQGRVLAFEHWLLHEASELKNGCKYAIRTEAMYTNSAAPW